MPIEGETVADRVARAVVAREAVKGEPWQLRAACGADPKLMSETQAPRVFDALAVCSNGCPVVAQCRAWADSEREYVGVAGGRVYTERQRAKRMEPRSTKNAARAS